MSETQMTTGRAGRTDKIFSRVDFEAHHARIAAIDAQLLEKHEEVKAICKQCVERVNANAADTLSSLTARLAEIAHERFALTFEKDNLITRCTRSRFSSTPYFRIRRA